jgi:hypothetical protein
MKEGMNEGVKGGMNEGINEGMNEGMNESMMCRYHSIVRQVLGSPSFRLGLRKF